MSDEETASFGFEDIPAAQKAGQVQAVFASVARRYDLMNDLMSGGVHRLWKTAMLNWLAPRPGSHLLDVAGGTGDIALRYLDRVDGAAKVTVCDLSPEMIAVGQDRATDLGRLQEIDWVCGNGEALPLADRSVDVYTIAFGLRNVTYIDKVLAEARRVLKPTGRFMCLEFSHVALPLLGEIYDRYSFSVLPRLGKLVAGDSDSYRYLAESIRRFPAQEALAEMMVTAGLGQVSVRNLSGGIAAMHSAWRI
ncbi:MAG: bifunctional demethylmenaquinone methyltransferase/2-methoxy-6-polyprenyl-1,4-benzoquinol methylase UbiE [Alphaproteobacteria bacterium]